MSFSVTNYVPHLHGISIPVPLPSCWLRRNPPSPCRRKELRKKSYPEIKIKHQRILKHSSPFSFILRLLSLSHQTPNTKHQTPNTKHQTPNTKHRTLHCPPRIPSQAPWAKVRSLRSSFLMYFITSGTYFSSF